MAGGGELGGALKLTKVALLEPTVSGGAVGLAENAGQRVDVAGQQFGPDGSNAPEKFQGIERQVPLKAGWELETPSPTGGEAVTTDTS